MRSEPMYFSDALTPQLFRCLTVCEPITSDADFIKGGRAKNVILMKVGGVFILEAGINTP